MKILLLSPPYLKDYMRNARCDFVSLSGTQWFPILLGYAGAFLETKGFKVKLIDAPAYNLGFKDVENIYSEYNPDFLVVYPGDKSRGSDIEFTDHLIDKRRIPVVFVGPYFGIEPRYFLEKGRNVKFGVLGEFEYPILELIRGDEPVRIKNLIWKDSSVIKENPLRPYLSRIELDSMPFVSDFFNRHLNFRYYRTPSEPHPFIDIMTGRGCIWGICGFCLWVYTFIKGRVYNTRSIENVMQELEFIENKMPFVRSIMIQDDTFPEDRIIEFCEEKLKRGFKIKWSCYVRADLDYHTLKLMREANCLNLHVGFESVNNEVLRKIAKGLTKEQMTQFAHDAKKAGLRIHGDFMIGLPGETRESLLDIIDWACKIRPYTAQFQILIPFKSTPLYKEMAVKGYLLNDAANYPNLPKEELQRISKLAYRRFYLNIFYFLQVLRNPYTIFFKKFSIILKSFASMFWQRLNIR